MVGENPHRGDYNEMQLYSVIKLWTVHRNLTPAIKRWFLLSSYPDYLFSSVIRGTRWQQCRDHMCVSVQGLEFAHVIECAELLTSSEGGTLKSSVPWNRPTPHVQGDWHCPILWHIPTSDGLTRPWSVPSFSFFLFPTLVLGKKKKTKLLIVYRLQVWSKLPPQHHL